MFDVRCVFTRHASKGTTRTNLLRRVLEGVTVGEGIRRFHTSELPSVFEDNRTGACYVSGIQLSKMNSSDEYCIVHAARRLS
jgi:hypothetical protein